MYARLATGHSGQIAQQFPAVLILGARQVGKTTLARAIGRRGFASAIDWLPG